MVNPEKYRLGTGKGNDVILKNIMYLAENHRDVLVRTPIIPDFNDTVNNMREHAAYLSRLGEKVKVELLPFHGICEKKRGPSFVRSIAPNNGSCTAACRGGGRRCRRKAPTAHSGFETTRGDANDAETPDCGLQGHCQQRGWGRGGRVGKGRKGEIQPLRAVRTLGVRRDVQRRRPRVCRLCSVGDLPHFQAVDRCRCGSGKTAPHFPVRRSASITKRSRSGVYAARCSGNETERRGGRKSRSGVQPDKNSKGSTAVAVGPLS